MNVTVAGVFISYAREDALEFAERLAADLREHHHQVFFDLQNIEKGGLWEVRLEQGIRRSTLVVAALTPGALRAQSVCRDEIVFALNEGKTVLPLKVDDSPTTRPTLLLARRNWIDFSASYDTGLECLLRYLSGDPLALQPPPVPTITGVIPLDFGPEIARLTAHFAGRDWLDAEVESWLGDPKGRAFVLVGEPGIGKSAIAAWLSVRRPEQTVAVHFCTDRNSRTLEPSEFVASLVGQLCTQVPGFEEIVALRQPQARRAQASDAFRELVVEPAHQVRTPPAPLLMVVDSLDESIRKKGETLLDVLVQQAGDLPFWLRFFATTRPEAPVLRKIRQLHPFDLRAEGANNLADVKKYIDDRTARLQSTGQLSERSARSVAARLPDLARGNFLYACMALDALDERTLSPEDLYELSPGISDFYVKTFGKLFPEDRTFQEDAQPLLRTLSVAMAPVPFEILDRISRQPQESEETTHRRLLRLRAYLRVTGEGGPGSAYALFHKSLGDWLVDAQEADSFWCSRAIGMADLADACWQDYGNDPERMTEYALRYAMFHLRAVGRDDEARAISRDETVRRRRSELGVGSFFLSYARDDDEPFAWRLHRDLASRGFDIWFDRDALPGRGRMFLLEVREGIEDYDRLVLVAGPHALNSDSTSAEWQYAIESGKDVITVLRLGDFADLPIELNQLHVHDFRDDARYETSFDALIRRVTAPLPPLGELFDVPPLPPSYVALRGRLRELKDLLLADLSRAVVVPRADIAGITGMGGIGKTVLASAFARDPQVRRAFPDGILWITVGDDPDLVQLQRNLASRLGDHNHGFTTYEDGRYRLRMLLDRRRALLIFDDVWKSGHVHALHVGGSLCRSLLITRHLNIISELGVRAVQMDALPEADALALLALETEASVEELPAAALEVAELCQGWPLLLSLVSGQVRGGHSWNQVRDRLRETSEESDLELGPHHRRRSLEASLRLSYEALSELEKELLLDLSATLEEAKPRPAAELVRLWTTSRGIGKFEGEAAFDALNSHGFLDTRRGTAGEQLVTIHPLLHEFLRSISA